MVFIAISLQILWHEFYRNVAWVVFYQTYYLCPNLLIWLIAMATERLNLRNNICKKIS